VQHRRKSESAPCRFRLRSESEVWAQNAEVNIVGGNGVNAMSVDVETTCKDALARRQDQHALCLGVDRVFPTPPVHSPQLSALPARRSTSKISTSGDVMPVNPVGLTGGLVGRSFGT